VLPRLVTHGTFMDGLWYDTIARNQAIGMGSFWRPMLTPTVSPDFFDDHPPLVFFIESLCFRAFGDHWWVAKLYGFVTALASAALIFALWRACGMKRNAWLPILLWIATPVVAWSFGNEMLENTMGLFQLGAAWAFVAASSRPGTRGDSLAALAGALLFAGVLCKGVVAPFPLAMPVMLSALAGRGTVRGALTQVFIAFAVLGALLWLTFQLHDARVFAERYLTTNFLPLASGQRGGVDNRLHIVGKLALELIPMFLVAGLIAWFGRTRDKAPVGLAKAFLATGLAGSLPLALSPIQSGFYLVPCFAFFALGFALLVEPRAQALLARLSKFERPLTLATGVLLGAALAFLASRAGAVGRGSPVLEDVRAIGKVVPPGTTVSTCPASFTEWSLHGYFMLYDRITLDVNSIDREWFVVEAGGCEPPPWYTKVAVPTRRLTLYRAAR